MQRDAARVYEEYLVYAARCGDGMAWTRLVQRWQPRLLRHAGRLCGSADEAGERVQEAWLDIVRGLGGLDDAAAFPAWALRILTRRCQRGWRSRQARGEVDLEEHQDSVPPQAQAPEAELALDLQTVIGALKQLPPMQRAALAMHHLDQLSVAEIAIALDVPPGTVKTRLMHARLKLRALLTPSQGVHDER